MMHKKNRYTHLGLFTAILGALLITEAPNICYAATTDTASQTVKVGIYPLGQFMNIDADENVSGYAVDYLDEIATHTGWNYEYVPCSNWIEAETMLENGTVDIVGPVQKSEGREQLFYFPDYEIGVESGIIYVRKDDKRYYLNDYDSFGGMRIALLENNELSHKFKAFAQDNDINVTTMDFSSEKEAFDALEQERVDAVLTGDLSGTSGYKSVCNFTTEPYYFVTEKDNQALGASLNQALGYIAANEKSFQYDLYRQYYTEAEAQLRLSFTREEQELINGTDALTIAFIPNRAPFSYLSPDGSISGISTDIIQAAAKEIGIELNCVMMENGQTPMDYLNSHPGSLVAGIMTDNEAFKNDDYLVSSPYYTDDVGIIGIKGAQYDLNAPDDTYVLAVPKSYSALSIYLEENCPQFQVVYASSVQDCLNMVENGQAQFAAQNVHVLTPFLSDPHYENLTVLPTFLTDEAMGVVGLTGTDNVNWIHIINKCIQAIPETTVSQIVVDHMIVNGYKTSLGDFIYKFRYAMMLILVLTFGMIALLFVYIESRRRHLKVLEDTNQKLEIAIEKANQASASKGTFLAQMSHEIRTPMNAIIGLTTLAHLDINHPEKMEEYLTKVDGSSKILLGIINDVLDMSKIETHKLKIGNAPFDFKQLLSSITTIYYQQCKQKGIEYEMKMENVTEEVLIGDSLRMNQVILNLLSNAVKFTPSGGKITVTVIQTSKTADQIHMRFMVSDNGCGMSEDLQKRLFLPFEQEDAATARKHGGSGLGLAICKNLTDLMNGQISVRSKKEEGSTFIVDIPFGRSFSQPVAPAISYKNTRVLIVDDDEESCKYIGSILDRLSVPYTYKTDGEAALAELGEAEQHHKPYQICIVDWKMPSMSGVEVTQQIRHIFGNDAVIVIVSAYDLNEIEAEGRKAGADYFIPKPLFQSTLNDVLARVNSNENELPVPAAAVSGNFHFSGRRVLVAEDVVLNMEVAVRLLELVDIKVECAEDGKQAVEMFKKSVPGYYDAILLDINMPVMDGFEAAQQIRASLHDDAKNITIYAMTANAFSEDVAKCMDAGMNGHIAKPIETQVLYKMLDEAFLRK